jgi:hypothetical protein
MPALLRDAACPSCGRRHHFCLPVGDLTLDQDYDYVCPETGRHDLLRPGAPAEPVRYPPQGAVQLTPARGTQTVS